MRVLNPDLDLDAYFAQLARASARVLLLDYDGTLAPFAVRPERARPYPGVRSEIERILEDARTRVVIVSGRRLEDLAPLVAWGRGLELWGTHGFERRTANGRTQRSEPQPAARERLARAEALARGLARPGARIETKPAAVAVHWRGLPAIAAARLREEVRQAWEPLAGEGAVELLDFDGGLELRAAGPNKAHAVRTVLAESGGAAAAYLGDDLTDEEAFAAVKPHGLAVLVRGELRATGADLWLRPPRELIAFLRRWRESGQAQPRGAQARALP